MADGYLNFDTKINTSGFTSGLKTVSAGMAAAVGAAGVAFTAVSKSALDSVASLEQNIGGVETLFKGSAQTVIDNANKAFETAGLSANEYMQNVTSFSASLLQSLDGDTKAAAKSADMAMIDMSDNANKMGTDMVNIQNAYQGFAKQNYTMLDNLKLGYGGTKTEMQRLLKDAQKISGIKYDINNLSDVYEAIHVIQNELGITGTTAKEAATTIEGSMSAAKASFDNFLNGSGTAEELANSVATAAQNVVKNLEEIVPRLAKTIPEAAGILADSVSDALSDGAADQIFAAAGEMVSNLMLGIMNAIPVLFSVGTEAVMTLVQGIAQGIPSLAQTAGQVLQQFLSSINDPVITTAGINLLLQLGAGLQQAIPEFLANALPVLAGFSESLLKNAGLLVDAGIQFIYNLVDGLVAALPDLIEYGPTIIKNLANIINQNVPKLIIAGANIILKLIDGIVRNIPNLIARFPEMVKAIVAVIGAVNWIGLGKSIIAGIANGVKNLAGKIPSAVKNIATNAFNGFKTTNWASLGHNLITKIGSGIAGLVSKIPTALTKIGTNAMRAFVKLDWKSIGKNIITGIASGISGAAGAIADAAKQAAKNALSSAKKFLGIASPSKRARKEIGQMYGEGVELGILDEVDDVGKASQILTDNAVQEIDVPDYTAIASMARNKVLASTAAIGRTDDVTARVLRASDISINMPGRRYGENNDTDLKSSDITTDNMNKIKKAVKDGIQEGMKDMKVEMDGRETGKIVAPHVNEFMPQPAW